MEINKIKDIIKNSGINPSIQRIKIFEFLTNSLEHPTVDTIYKGLINEIPTLSRTTVYNTLKNFAKKNLILEITIDEKEVRYDYNTSNHAHFKCIKCNKVFDIFSFDKFIKNDEIEGNKIYNQHFYFNGICKECKKKNN